MARLKLLQIGSQSSARANGLPIGFAMARLKPICMESRAIGTPWLTDRIRDGAIETPPDRKPIECSRKRLTDRIRDGAIETHLYGIPRNRDAMAYRSDSRWRD